MPTNRLLNVTEVSGGKTAQHGCPDFLAADEVLKQARLDGVLGVREGGHLQGKYGGIFLSRAPAGERMFMFLRPRPSDPLLLGTRTGGYRQRQLEAQRHRRTDAQTRCTTRDIIFGRLHHPPS